MTNLFLIILALTLVLCNAFFVAAEFGMVKLRNTRVAVIKKQYGLRGTILAHVHKHLDAYLSACQLGITLASLGLGWVGEPAFEYLFRPFFQFIGITSHKTLQAFSLTTAFFFISFLHIVVGELMPKSIAIRRAEKISVWTAIPLYCFYWIMYPIIWFMNTTSNALVHFTGLAKGRAGEGFYSTDEIKMILSSSYLHGELSREERKILEHTLDLGDLNVTDVMRPVEEMVALDVNQPIEEALMKAIQFRYSRYPIYENRADNIIGIVHVKDLFAQLYQQHEMQHLRELIRPVLKVSRRLPALEVLRKFREGMPHFALVYTARDENLIGFVTLDNLLHVLVGRIKDEFHRTRDDWVKNEDGSFTIPGNASIYTLERALGIDIELEGIEDDVDTITGLVLSRVATMPKSRTRISFNQFDLIIEKTRGPRILQVRVYPKVMSE